MRTALLLVAALACAALGFLAGRLGSSPATVPRAEDRRPAAEDAPPERTGEAGPSAPPPSARALLEDDAGAIVTAEVARRAAEIRERALQQADHAEEIARRQVEAEIARERAFLEDAARGGTMALLQALRKDWNAPWEMISSPERYGALFERRAAGPVIAGTSLDQDLAVADGTVLRFPRGRFTLDARLPRRWDPFPKDLVIEGSGMDATLLVLSEELRPRGDVHSLTFRELTLHCNDNYLEAIRNGSYTLRLERCRVIGFDMGAGGSCMLGGHAGAFYATDCRIEAGFGRSPGFGNLFDVRGAFLARLERCVIVGPFRSVYYQWSKAAQVFVECRFERMHPRIRDHLERANPAVRFHECTFEYLEPDAPTHPERRPVTDINPDWGG